MLIALILVPLLGAAISALLNRASAVARVVAVSTTVVTAVLAVLVWNSYRVAGDALTYALTGTGPGSFVTLAADGIAIPLVALTALLGFVAVVVSWDAERPGSCFALLLALEAAVMAVFLAADLILFYVAWEAVLIPMFFLIGGWGHDNRRYAAMKFFIYTFVGSAFMLLGLVFMVLAQSGGHAMPAAGALRLGDHEGLVFLLLAVGFVVKIPVVPFHTWLPDAHVEAPTAGSIMLAGVLLKMGAYGFIRFCIPYTPEAFAKAAPLLGALGLAGIVYGAVVALGQSDLKRLVAYSSVAHMGFVVLGLASRTTLGVQGAILGMVS
ncbi:MAG: NADH-quinone oxidoreductase subunit M, partial [Coriobacteriia bacterium]|nr:NADH-quinone oxidoreductase subunit M [Coriobacteriia bacterium]